MPALSNLSDGTIDRRIEVLLSLQPEFRRSSQHRRKRRRCGLVDLPRSVYETPDSIKPILEALGEVMRGDVSSLHDRTDRVAGFRKPVGCGVLVNHGTSDMAVSFTNSTLAQSIRPAPVMTTF
ncbi:hypothetical protein D3C87_1638430 [compost metagenome]